ncbi:MAG: hypothetical protein JSV91_06280 [Phycisphaerales bacterium]|nr:MAG: hypothetical protein JSV91_06280 [Phycisphaerales bacterium]
MAPNPDEKPDLLSPRKLITQSLGFVIGMALLIWCIVIAVKGGEGEDISGWAKIREASPLLVAGLAGCSLISLFVNGVIFWLVILPVKNLGMWRMEWLNLVTGVLNYAPIRAGLLARIAYNLRVDRLSLLQLGGWFLALAFTMVLTLGACILATIVWPDFDLIWVAILLGQLILGGLLAWAVMGHPLIIRHGKGMDQMLRRPVCLWGAIGLRLIDISAYVGRMACAAAILDLSLPFADIMLLGFAALALSLNPLGRIGFREAAVAFVASRLVAPELGGAHLEASMAQLALVESAGEAMLFIPIGAIALLWYRKRWRDAAAANGQIDDAD